MKRLWCVNQTATGLKQVKGDFRCVSFVAAMATGTTPEEFEAFAAAMPQWSKNEPPYEDIHFYSYLLSKGFLCGLGFSDKTPEGGLIRIDYDVRKNPAYVVAYSDLGGHALYWDGSQICDPDPDTKNGKPINEYKVQLWVPIYKI